MCESSSKLQGDALGGHWGRVDPTESIPPERVFSILNDIFEDDMDRSLADYIELSLQLQFNSRSRAAAPMTVICVKHC